MLGRYMHRAELHSPRDAGARCGSARSCGEGARGGVGGAQTEAFDMETPAAAPAGNDSPRGPSRRIAGNGWQWVVTGGWLDGQIRRSVDKIGTSVDRYVGRSVGSEDR